MGLTWLLLHNLLPLLDRKLFIHALLLRLLSIHRALWLLSLLLFIHVLLLILLLGIQVLL